MKWERENNKENKTKMLRNENSSVKNEKKFYFVLTLILLKKYF